MIKRIEVFETTDGTRFDDWEEAFNHQFTLNWSNLSENDVVIKDRFGGKASYDYWFNNFDSAFYVEIKSSLGQRFIDEAADNQGVDTISGLGRYRWDEDLESWISFEEDFKRFQENWDKFTKS